MSLECLKYLPTKEQLQLNDKTGIRIASKLRSYQGWVVHLFLMRQQII